MKRGKGHLKTRTARLIKGRRNSEGWDKPKLPGGFEGDPPSM